MKRYSYRFSDETAQKLLEIGLAEATIKTKRVNTTQSLRDMIDKRHKELKETIWNLLKK